MSGWGIAALAACAFCVASCALVAVRYLSCERAMRRRAAGGIAEMRSTGTAEERIAVFERFSADLERIRRDHGFR